MHRQRNPHHESVRVVRRSARRGLLNAALTSAAMMIGHGIASAAPLAGRYHVAAGPDVAGEIVLRADNSFDYFLAAGSLGEHARGKWSVEGNALHLVTLPKPVPATFAAGAIAVAADAPLVLHVIDPGGCGIAAVELRVGFDMGEEAEGYTQDYGWSLPPTETRVPRWVEFAVPIYGLRSQRFAIDLTRGHAFSFVLTPNDLGTVDFADVRIDLEPGRLLVHREAGVLMFRAAAE